MVEIVVVESAEQAGERAASTILALVAHSPDAVLGLTTGSTPLTTWAALRRADADFARVRAFALDEYVGLPREHPASARAVLTREIVGPLGMTLRVPGDDGGSLESAPQRYESALVDAGGVDLQLLSMGGTGHLGFSLPGSPLDALAHVAAIPERMRVDAASAFGSLDEVPRHALTQGLGTIRRARHLVLLVFGERKAAAVAAALEGPVSASAPASILQLHERATVILDRGAASLLREDRRHG